MPILAEGRRLCAAYGLDPLGAIASGALIVAVDPANAEALIEAYRRDGTPCADIGELTPADEGITMVTGGERHPLPRYDSDRVHIF